MSAQDLHQMGVAELSAAIANQQTSSVEVAQALLARAKQHEPLGAYLSFNEEATLAQARAADARIAAGERGPLLGVPLAHKDIFVTQDFPSTAGSKMLQGYQSPFDATVVAKLAKAGAVTLGKLNCDEFAMGGSNENSAYGVARNPWDAERVPGGSSGGSAVAVALGLCVAATATDTGGSIRHPAAACGVVGLKPTRHSYPLQGVLALAPSLDVAGFLTRSTLDQALLWDAWHGSDTAQRCMAAQPAVFQGLRIGVPEDLWTDDDGSATHDAQIRACFEDLLLRLQAHGAQVVPVRLPPRAQVVQAANSVIAFEAFVQLQRLWRERPQDLGQGLRAKLEAAARVDPGTYHAACVQAAQWQAAMKACMPGQVDVMMWPGREALPETLQALMDRPMAQRSACNRLWSLTGHPALTCPMGVASQGLPMAVQIAADWHQEALLLQIGHGLEQLLDWQLPALMA